LAVPVVAKIPAHIMGSGAELTPEFVDQDLMSGDRFTWTGKVQHVELDPSTRPYAIWRLIPPGRDH
jgi:starch synthase (maltosyl-transferring)